jgi:hypothetical protein
MSAASEYKRFSSAYAFWTATIVLYNTILLACLKSQLTLPPRRKHNYPYLQVLPPDPATRYSLTCCLYQLNGYSKVPMQVVNAYGSSLKFRTRWMWVVSFAVRSVFLGGRTPRWQSKRRLVEPQSRSGRFGEEVNRKWICELYFMPCRPRVKRATLCVGIAVDIFSTDMYSTQHILTRCAVHHHYTD